MSDATPPEDVLQAILLALCITISLAVVGTLGWVLSQVGFAAKLEPPPIALQQPAAPVVAVADQAAPTSAPVAMPVGQYPQCQNLQTVEQIAQTIGGPAADWSPPDWVSSTTQGAFTFRSRYVNHLTYPGFGFFDTPAGRFVQGDVDASEASFHCEEPPTS